MALKIQHCRPILIHIPLDLYNVLIILMHPHPWWWWGYYFWFYIGFFSSYRQTDRPTNLNPMTKDSWHGCRCLIASCNESRSSLVVISVAMNGWFVVWLPFDWTHYDILWIEIWLRILRSTLVSISLLSLSIPLPWLFFVILIVAYTHTHCERKSSSQIQM